MAAIARLMSELLGVILDYLCAQRPQVAVLFSMCSLGLVITVLLLLHFPPGTGAYVVSVINLLGLIPLVGGMGYALYACNKRL